MTYLRDRKKNDDIIGTDLASLSLALSRYMASGDSREFSAPLRLLARSLSVSAAPEIKVVCFRLVLARPDERKARGKT